MWRCDGDNCTRCHHLSDSRFHGWDSHGLVPCLDILRIPVFCGFLGFVSHYPQDFEPRAEPVLLLMMLHIALYQFKNHTFTCMGT